MNDTSTLAGIKALAPDELWAMVWELECLAERGPIFVIDPEYFWICSPRIAQ